MSREKQIDEMAKVIAKADDTCRRRTIAETLYNAGYRKREVVINEFAERLKRFYNSLKGEFPTPAIVYHIDQIAKELIGGSK